MSYVRTFPGQIQKRLQYVEETTYGTTPIASPLFISAGKIKRFSWTVDGQVQRYRSIGLRTVCSFLQTSQMSSFEIEYWPFDAKLMKYGFNDPVGAGTIAKSLSFLYSYLLNGVENYVIIKGAKTDQITLEINQESVQVTQSFLCKEITTPAITSGLTTPTFAAAPTGIPWTGKSGGADPFIFNGIPWDTPRFNVECSWNLDPGMPNGTALIKFLDPTNKDVNVDFDVWQKDTTFIADLKNDAERDITYTINSASSCVLTVTDYHNETYTYEADAESNETTIDPASGGAKDVSIAET